MMHTTGKKGYACLKDSLVKESGFEVSKTNVWIAAHTRKDGTPIDEAARQTIARMRKTLIASTKSSSMRDDPIAKVLAPERPRQVRGCGLGVTPSSIDAHTH